MDKINVLSYQDLQRIPLLLQYLTLVLVLELKIQHNQAIK